MPDKITEIYAFIALEADGSEGIPAFVASNGMVMPMIGADLDRVETLRPIAEEIAELKGVSMTLALFEHRTDLERFPASDPDEPEGGDNSG